MNTFASNGRTIRHTHTARLDWNGLHMQTTRDGVERDIGTLTFDVYDSCDPTAILKVAALFDDSDAFAGIILNHEQVAALVKAGQAFLEQYPHGVESARRLEGMS